MNRRSIQRVLMGLQVFLLVGAIGTLVLLLRLKDDQTEKTEDASVVNAAVGGKTVVSDSENRMDGALAEAESFTFDPNTADSATLVRVGLSPLQARNVIRYRQKGGCYHRPEDFKRLYGLTVGQWEHLAPLIRIAKEYQYIADNEEVNRSYLSRQGSRASERDSIASPFTSQNRIPKLRQGETVALATADTMTLQRIPGIGGYYARRIAEYGEKLGGYVSLDQLNDAALDFLPMDIEQYLTLGECHVRKVHVNKLSVRELSRHPYISYPQAKQIAERVRAYGALKDWNELLFLSEFTERDKARLEPYLSFE